MEKFKFEEDVHSGVFYLYEGENKIGEITFRKLPGEVISVNHTYVNGNLQGRGYGKKLVDKVIAYAEENGLNLSATCWFADKILQSIQNE